MPSRWEVSLSGPAEAAISLTAPHAVVSRWLDNPRRPKGGTVRGPRSDHGDQAKKWASGPIRAARDGHSEAGIALQVRLLDDGLADRLRATTPPGTTVSFGAHQYQICSPTRMLDRVPWQGLRRWQGTRAWQVRFVTPACTRRRNRAAPLLAPDALARGLAERWRRLEPTSAPSLPWRGACPVWLSDLDGHSEVQILSRRAERAGRPDRSEEILSGFLGRARYVCDQGNEADAACFDALLTFAAFAGAGSHTAYGFGVVIADPTWQPPTVQAAGR